MNKFKKLLLLFTLTYQSFLWAECSDEDKNSQIKLADGEIKLDEETSLGFKSALLKPNEVSSSSLISPSANFICEFLSSSEHSAHKKL